MYSVTSPGTSLLKSELLTLKGSASHKEDIDCVKIAIKESDH
jgi:hypothetical protein